MKTDSSHLLSEEVRPLSLRNLLLFLPFAVGMANRFDLALLFSACLALILVVVTILLSVIKDGVRTELAMFFSAILATGFLIIAETLFPVLSLQVGLYLGVLSVSPYLLLPLVENQAAPLGEQLKIALVRWAQSVAFLLPLALLRELIGSGSISLGFDAASTFKLLIPGYSDQPFAVIALAPGGFFLMGLVVVVVRARNQSKNAQLAPESAIDKDGTA